MGRFNTKSFLFLYCAIFGQLFSILWVQVIAQHDMSSTTITHEASNTTFRICVPNVLKRACESMNEHVSDGKIHCVFANDKIGCIEKLAKNEADFLPLQPEEIFIASKFKDSAFNVIGEIRSTQFKDRNFRYEPVAVIRNSANIKSIGDLKGKNSCHTGFGRNAGWKIPFSHLLDQGQLSPFCNEIQAPIYERDLYVISKYFGKVCAPGPWVPEKDTNRALQQKYSNLCELCENASDCNGNDKYSGYEGALKCLTNNHGDVAWTKMDAVENYFKLNNNVSVPISITSQFSFLCWDGSSMPLTSTNPCSMAKRPWGAYLISSQHNKEYIENLQSTLRLYEAISNEDPISLVLELNSTNQELYEYSAKLSKTITPRTYLDLSNYTVSIEKPSCPPSIPAASASSAIRVCVLNELEKMKCSDLKLAALGQRILPELRCIVGGSLDECFKKIRDGHADVINVNPKQAQIAKSQYGLVPLLSELEHLDHDTRPEPFRYALSIVKKDSGILNITQLKGSKSCHGSITSLAGWYIPLRVLRQNKLLQEGNVCSLNTFFNGTCVPGGRNLKYHQPWHPKTLCELCIGDSSDNDTRTPSTYCSNSALETYYGDYGALKCLEDNVADVAFIDHITVLELLHDSNMDSKIDSLRLLCVHGGQMELKDFRHCNWGKIPSNQIITREANDANYIERENARFTLLKASSIFSPLGKSSIIMDMFGPYYGNKDLLFKDTSIGLIDYTRNDGHGGSSSQEVDEILYDIVQDVDPCSSPSASISISTISYSVLISICLLLTSVTTKLVFAQ